MAKPIEVYFLDVANFAKPLHVATVEIADDAETNYALEYAYMRTQNMFGSWSQGPYIEGEPNADHHPSVTRHAPLHTSKSGQTYGLRSSMVGDVLRYEGKSYRVASQGFELLDDAALRLEAHA